MNPTVISMDRNKFEWNTSFPSCESNLWGGFKKFIDDLYLFIYPVTVCSEKRIDENKLTAYIEKNPKMFPNETARSNARLFFKRLATISYETMVDFPLDIDPGINPDEYLELMDELKWEFVPEISSGTSNKLIMMRTITENGICDAVNSKVAYYNSFEYWKNKRWDFVKPNITVVVHPFDGEIYAQLTNLSTSYTMFYVSNFVFYWNQNIKVLDFQSMAQWKLRIFQSRNIFFPRLITRQLNF